MDKKFIARIFKYALETEATILSLENASRDISVRYLLPDGESRILKLPKKVEQDWGEGLRQLLKLPSGELVNKKYCKLDNSGTRLNFLLTISPSRDGERIIIKIIPKNKQVLRLNQLGLERIPLRALRVVLKKRSGLILVTSPDNQGRSTTLAALAKELDKPDISTYWLGSTPESEFANITTLADNDNNWEKVLRLDSEVIINEIRSIKNLATAIHAASTGRLVIAALKADSVWQGLETILKAPGAVRLKSQALALIMNQRLVALKRSTLTSQASKKPTRQIIGLFETLALSASLRNAINSGRQAKNKQSFWTDLAALARQNDYFSLKDDYRQKKKNGLL